ncbi:MAG TPA: ATP-dependent DNA ligase [Fimbriimonadaceae bacterium]|nr:ATP-dependent DNA ligase [Fimbriimonadaceae bacterium]
MREFAALYTALDDTNKTNEKVAAMVRYFEIAPSADAAWAVHFLIGRRPKRLIKGPDLWEWAIEASGLPTWLFAECYDAVGDTAETIAAVLPDQKPPSSVFSRRDPEPPSSVFSRRGPTDGAQPGSRKTEEGGWGVEEVSAHAGLAAWVENRLLPLAGLPEPEQRAALQRAWSELDRSGRLVFNKLITGAFRVGVSQDLVVRALAQCSGIPTPVIAHRLMGAWEPSGAFFESLVASDSRDADISQPYPFCLAHPLATEVAKLGDIRDWHAEWKWDGIRAQLIRREGRSFVWSRGEDLITERFPEIEAVCDNLPEGTVIDGEILAWMSGKPMKFLDLQQRIGRKVLSKKILEKIPVVLVAFDVLQWQGEDVRAKPFLERRALLERLPVMISPSVEADTWEDLAELREQARSRGVEGLMLKRTDSPYLVGRKKGLWWKWKIEPMTVDCVLIYAMRGSGKRASLYTDYTFGVWNGDELVSFAKAYSGLTDEEIRRVDSWIRRNTIERVGPVRTVKPELVFELGFEAIQLSSRHKSGVAVRFPRILRWRHDKTPQDADTLENIKQVLLGE